MLASQCHQLQGRWSLKQTIDHQTVINRQPAAMHSDSARALAYFQSEHLGKDYWSRQVSYQLLRKSYCFAVRLAAGHLCFQKDCY